jgi:hypothetical protein
LPDRARQAAKKVIWKRKRKRMQVPATIYVFLFLINAIKSIINNLYTLLNKTVE